MPYDFKKEYKELYQPKKIPTIVDVPPVKYIAVRGTGNPNEEGGAYKNAVESLYGVAYTLKMSYKTEYTIEGFFEYVVPPLEGFWWQEGIDGYDSNRKDLLSFISVIRIPDFVTEKDVEWAKETIRKKKKRDYSDVMYLTYEEGLCVQCMHIGPYDNEPETVLAMEDYMKEQGYILDFSDTRRHHEVYISDPRKVAVSKLKTILRHPIKKNSTDKS